MPAAGSVHDAACYSSDAAARTLVLFSLLYLLLQLPLGVVETVELYWDVTLYHPPSSDAAKRASYISWLIRKLQLKWSRSLLFWLFQLSFVLNFVVYLKSGNRFRAVAKSMAWRWLSCGLLGPLHSARQSLASLPRQLARLGTSSRSPTVTCHSSPPVSPGPPGADADLNLDCGPSECSEPPEDVAVAVTEVTVDPAPDMRACSSTESFSSLGSLGNAGTSAGLGLCWRRRQPRPRARTNSCPHRHRCSPCRPCRRARIQTWANYARSQGFKALSCGGSDARAILSTSSGSTCPLTASSDVDSDSVFDSPLFVVHAEDTVKDLGSFVNPAFQTDQLPVQDPIGAYASPALCPPRQDLMSLLLLGDEAAGQDHADEGPEGTAPWRGGGGADDASVPDEARRRSSKCELPLSRASRPSRPLGRYLSEDGALT